MWPAIRRVLGLDRRRAFDAAGGGRRWEGASMLRTTMLSGIIKGRAMSFCSLVVRTSVVTSLFNAASDWAACCAITIRRQRSGVRANERTG